MQETIHSFLMLLDPLHHPEVATQLLVYILPVIANSDADIYTCF
jgi:hypothetical protein